jgi:hypothetical protein
MNKKFYRTTNLNVWVYTMNKKFLTEQQILDYIDGGILEMGLRGGDRGRDRDRDRDSDRSGDRGKNSIDTFDEFEKNSEIIGQTLDIYGNNMLFDE